MIRKGQLTATGRLRLAQQFSSLATMTAMAARGCSVVAQNS
jgi:hypothetical protein